MKWIPISKSYPGIVIHLVCRRKIQQNIVGKKAAIPKNSIYPLSSIYWDASFYFDCIPTHQNTNGYTYLKLGPASVLVSRFSHWDDAPAKQRQGRKDSADVEPDLDYHDTTAPLQVATCLVDTSDAAADLTR